MTRRNKKGAKTMFPCTGPVPGECKFNKSKGATRCRETLPGSSTATTSIRWCGFRLGTSEVRKSLHSGGITVAVSLIVPLSLPKLVSTTPPICGGSAYEQPGTKST